MCVYVCVCLCVCVLTRRKRKRERKMNIGGRCACLSADQLGTQWGGALCAGTERGLARHVSMKLHAGNNAYFIKPDKQERDRKKEREKEKEEESVCVCC